MLSGVGVVANRSCEEQRSQLLPCKRRNTNSQSVVMEVYAGVAGECKRQREE